MEQVRAAEYRARQVAMTQMNTETKQPSQGGAGDGEYCTLISCKMALCDDAKCICSAEAARI